VFSILHGDLDYYYDLAVRHDPDVDVFIAVSAVIHRRLLERLPHRRDAILYLPTGVRLGPVRTAAEGPLRILFSGRVEHDQKGVLDLPRIATALRRLGVTATWTVQGDGPDLEALRRGWLDGDVRFTGARPLDAALAELPRHDIFLMPSTWEGLPASLLEAAAAGLVPVVSDLPGLADVVVDGVSGYRVAAGHVDGFAAAIARLATDRPLLERLGAAARARAAERWDIERNALAFHAQFARWREWRRPHRPDRRVPYGSRLDQPWLPNAVVKAVRHFTWRQ
jgi:glycosyltransferase involved in cell wall biosynthesis